MGPGSQVPGEGSKVEGPGSQIPLMGPGSRAPGPGSNFSGMLINLSQMCKLLKRAVLVKEHVSEAGLHIADFKLDVLKIFLNSTGKHLCWNLFLIKLPNGFTTLLKRDFITGVFLWNLQNFQEHLFYKRVSGAASDV